MSKEQIATTIRRHIFEDTILCTQDAEQNYTGVLLWSYVNWIPMEIYVNQLVGKGQGGKLLKKLKERLPPSFHIWASRSGGKTTKVYKDPDKVIKYMLRQDSKKGIS